MQFLIIGDSHCKDLVAIVTKLYPGSCTFVHTRSRNNEIIINAYRENHNNVKSVRPDIIIIHMGHNNISYHHRYNTMPQGAKSVTEQNVAFARELKQNYPHARIFLSPIFPRTFTYGSSLNEYEVMQITKLRRGTANAPVP